MTTTRARRGGPDAGTAGEGRRTAPGTAAQTARPPTVRRTDRRSGRVRRRRPTAVRSRRGSPGRPSSRRPRQQLALVVEVDDPLAPAPDLRLSRMERVLCVMRESPAWSRSPCGWGSCARPPARVAVGPVWKHGCRDGEVSGAQCRCGRGRGRDLAGLGSSSPRAQCTRERQQQRREREKLPHAVHIDRVRRSLTGSCSDDRVQVPVHHRGPREQRDHSAHARNGPNGTAVLRPSATPVRAMIAAPTSVPRGLRPARRLRPTARGTDPSTAASFTSPIPIPRGREREQEQEAAGGSAAISCSGTFAGSVASPIATPLSRLGA